MSEAGKSRLTFLQAEGWSTWEYRDFQKGIKVIENVLKLLKHWYTYLKTEREIYAKRPCSQGKRHEELSYRSQEMLIFSEEDKLKEFTSAEKKWKFAVTLIWISWASWLVRKWRLAIWIFFVLCNIWIALLLSKERLFSSNILKVFACLIDTMTLKTWNAYQREDLYERHYLRNEH